MKKTIAMAFAISLFFAYSNQKSEDKTATTDSTAAAAAQWIHTAMHFDANDKIDRVVQFLDRAPINAASKK